METIGRTENRNQQGYECYDSMRDMRVMIQIFLN